MSRFYNQPIFGLAADALRRTQRVVSQNELLPFDQRTKRRRHRPSNPYVEIPCQVPSGISAGTPAKPATAFAVMYEPVTPFDPANPAAMAATGRIIKIWNAQPTAVPSNAMVWAKPWNNRWYSGAYICCSMSHSSSSSTSSDGCPTNACIHCAPDAPCDLQIATNCIAGGDPPFYLDCAGMNGNWTVTHVKGTCEWFAPDGTNTSGTGNNGTSCELFYNGTEWIIELVGHGHIVHFVLPGSYTCHGKYTAKFHDSDICTEINPGMCGAAVQSL